jgi:hypothetical protein
MSHNTERLNAEIATVSELYNESLELGDILGTYSYKSRLIALEEELREDVSAVVEKSNN